MQNKVPYAQKWWLCLCDQCGSSATKKWDAFWCSKELCTCRSASPSYRLGVGASDGDTVVDMVFFEDVAIDLIGKPADVLVLPCLWKLVVWLEGDMLLRKLARRYCQD